LYNLSAGDLTPDVVVIFLSSQLFLATRFRGTSQRLDKSTPVQRKLSKADAGEMYGNGMQCELFDIFQKHRGMVMGWLISDKARCNQVFGLHWNLHLPPHTITPHIYTRVHM